MDIESCMLSLFFLFGNIMGMKKYYLFSTIYYQLLIVLKKKLVIFKDKISNYTILILYLNANNIKYTANNQN